MNCLEPVILIGKCTIESMWVSSNNAGHGNKFYWLKDEPGNTTTLLDRDSPRGNQQIMVSDKMSSKEYIAKLVEMANSCQGWSRQCFPEKNCGSVPAGIAQPDSEEFSADLLK